MTSLSHKTNPTSMKKCVFVFFFPSVMWGAMIVFYHGHVTAADKVSDGRHWAGGHRRLVGDCYRGESGSVTLHSRLTLALHLRTPFTLGQRLHCDAHTWNIQFYTVGLRVPSLISSFSLFLSPSHNFFFLPSAHHILLFPLLLNLLLSLTWRWQTIVCGAFTGSPPTN